MESSAPGPWPLSASVLCLRDPSPFKAPGSGRSPAVAASGSGAVRCPSGHGAGGEGGGHSCGSVRRFAKLLLRLPALRSIGLKCLEHLFFFKLIGDTPIDTFLMEMLEAPHQMT